MDQNEVVDQLLAECEVDHVGLWEVIDAVHFDLGIEEPSKVRAATMELVRRLLENPGVEVGVPAGDGQHFSPWKMSHEDAIKQIERQWDLLGREPTIGDIVWFSLEVPNPTPHIVK